MALGERKGCTGQLINELIFRMSTTSQHFPLGLAKKKPGETHSTFFVWGNRYYYAGF
jgi:hypothetical protein